MNILLKPFAWLLLMMYNLVNNYGIALIMFAILVKLILFPVSLKGKRSMIKMNMLSSKTQKLQKMYGNNQTKYNEELQKLYEEEGVNPMGGCLWSFIPLIILIPLYGVIRQPLQYMMHLSAEQIEAVAQAVNWGSKSIEMGWVKNVADAAANSYAGASSAYKELFLASLINEGNLSAVQAAAGEGAKIFAMNFNFLGIDLSQVPNWKFWSNGMNWTTIGLFLLVVVSAVSSIISMRVSMKTNSVNNGGNDQIAQTNKSMMWISPIMSIWIGFMMPGLLNVYWVANNVLAMAQELIAGKMLKKDYEKARIAQAEAAAQAKEDEKTRRREAAEKRAKEAEENRKKKKSGEKVEEEKRDAAFIEVSRVGIRSYARGRAYEPDRFGGVTPYRDPDELARERKTQEEQEAKAAEEKKNKKKGGKAEAEAVQPAPAPVEEPVIAAEEVPAAEEPVEEVTAPASEESAQCADEEPKTEE